MTDTKLEEGMMPSWRKVRSYAAIFLIFSITLLNGCVGGQTSGQQIVSPLYMLTTAGFQKWDINNETPKRQALMNNIPPGKITTYKANGGTYHVYADQDSNSLYVGDAVAYEKYLRMSKGQQVCERVEGTNQQEFWGCFVEFQGMGARPGTK